MNFSDHRKYWPLLSLITLKCWTSISCLREDKAAAPEHHSRGSAVSFVWLVLCWSVYKTTTPTFLRKEKALSPIRHSERKFGSLCRFLLTAHTLRLCWRAATHRLPLQLPPACKHVKPCRVCSTLAKLRERDDESPLTSFINADGRRGETLIYRRLYQSYWPFNRFNTCVKKHQTRSVITV